MKTGKELINEINSKIVLHGHLCFWWLGQHSFVVKTAGKVFYLDPYLSPHPDRQVPPLLKASEVTNADFITGSHDHEDHIDRKALPLMMKASPKSRLIIPQATWKSLEAIGIDGSRVILLDDEKKFEEEGVKITGIKAAHEFFDHDEKEGYPYLGYVVETDGITFYHSGDTCIYDGMASRLKAWNITVAFLPINGRDAKRLKAGCIGNMTYQEAVDLAGVIKPRLTVPSHYEMFAMNMEDPRLFGEYMNVKYTNLEYWIGEHGIAVGV
jgi:L-ascorbate 6-phosphate lactonase